MSAPSARGLFRATGKQSKPVAVRLLDGTIVKADGLEREKDDFYPTPPEPIRALIVAEGDRLRSFPCIWEPACGDGAMMRELMAAGFDVLGTDLIDRGATGKVAIRDFFAFRPDECVPPAIVTNPPYHECNWRNGQGRWIWHALDTLNIEYMALLMSWSWPGAGQHAALWAAHPPARVYLMRWKIDFTGQGSPPMLNAWFVWDRKWRGETVLRMMDRHDDSRQAELFGGAL